MTGRVLTRGAFGVAVLLACMPTEPCACPPARTSVVLYGEVRTAEGAPAAGAALQYLLALPAGAPGGEGLCEFDPVRNDADPTGASADAAGRFRTQIFSLFGPATRCLQVAASAAAGTAGVEALLVPFRQARPDSVGLVLTLR
jgi:hypothetical protein